jgi:hypothetical protein
MSESLFVRTNLRNGAEDSFWMVPEFVSGKYDGTSTFLKEAPAVGL